MSNMPQSGPTQAGFTLDVLRRHPDRTAFSWDGGALTYAGASDLIGRMQTVFAAHGLRRGDCVAILSGNRVDSWCASIAAQAGGMAITWVLYFASLEDQEHQLRDAGVDVLIVDANRGERGGELASRLDHLSKVFTLGPLDFGVDLIASARKAGAASPLCIAAPGDVASISYTGGTTGYPKGTVRRNSPLSTQAYAALLADFEIPNNPRFLLTGPISHLWGLKIVPTLLRGGSVHVIDSTSPDQIIAAIEREKSNFALMVPSTITALLDALGGRKSDLSSLELLLYGGASIAPEQLREGIGRVGPVFAQLYGQTECYPISYLRSGDHNPDRPELLTSCGQPSIGTAVAILDGDGVECAVGEVGEICVRSPMVMDSYKNLPELTKEVFRYDWLHTGDVGRMDEQGYLYLMDRLKDMIITNVGQNIYSRGVERVLTDHAEVAQAVVFGTPDEETGEAVNAAIIRSRGATVSALDLREYVRSRKGDVLVPHHVYFVDELPLTSLGKVDKQALRTRLSGNQVSDK
ncbi:AMP-binding protein [Streptomyces sp. NPDC056749]|uniref:AMP-binding protein n=1 Tax=Streptomyces sp. NPDC056749 TaxID=3345936 RepID=UPI00367DB2DC